MNDYNDKRSILIVDDIIENVDVLAAILEPEYRIKEHLALVRGDIKDRDDVPVRIHSECFTGDVLGSLRCDCGEQLQLSQEYIAHQGRGVVVYLRQEGRGIGLMEKLRAYN